MSSRTLLLLLAAISASLSSCQDGDDPPPPPPPPGSLDPTFGGNGNVSTPMGTEVDDAVAVAIQPDGKIVVAGFSASGGFQDLAVARYNPDGSLDAPFGTGGRVIMDFDGSHDGAYSVALQPDGKIVIAGGATVGGLFRVVVVRLTTTGSPDASFDGDGAVIGDVGNAHSMALQADGKIVVAGSFHTNPNTDFAVWRYNPDGSPDASFDFDGRSTTAVGPGSSAGWSVAIQPDGKIVVGGDSYRSTTDFAVVRYDADGSLDANFGVGGIQISDITGNFDWGRSLALQSDGRIVLAGSAVGPFGHVFAAIRYRANGSQDPDFGVGGILVTDFGPFNSEARGVAFQADGKIILVGYASNPSNDDLALARYNPDGSLDPDFDEDGRVTTAVGQDIDQLNAVAIDSDGRIVAVGATYHGANADFLVTRYFN